MKKYFLALLTTLIMLPFVTGCTEEPQETTGTISGVITSDADGTDPLEGVNISITSLGVSTTSGRNGGYSFTDIVPGNYTIQFVKNGYLTDTRNVTVVAGETSVVDMVLRQVQNVAGIGLSHSMLLFDRGVSELVLRITNNGSTPTVNWLIDGITASWLSVSPRTGETNAGMSSTVKVTVDRSLITSTSNVSTTFNVRGEGFSLPVTVEVSNSTSSGNETGVTGTVKGRVTDSATGAAIANALAFVMPGFDGSLSDANGFFEIGNLNPGNYTLTVTADDYDDAEVKLTVNGGKETSVNVRLVKKSSVNPDDPVIPDIEDYSKAKVESCDSRVAVKITGCHRFSDSVTFDYTLTNNGLGFLNDWRMYPPGATTIVGGTQTSIWTNDGAEYDTYKTTMTFRGQTIYKNSATAFNFPEEVPCKGSITITGVDPSATELNINLGVFAYPQSQYNLTKTVITFRKVPIF